jgi:DNA-binding transcriptional LysR family regulator
MRLEDLDFAKLRAFQLVATHGTLAAAATQLGLTIPAISAKLKRLDEVMGVPLFRRMPNGLALTAAGEHFLRDLAPFLAEAERMIGAVRHEAARSQETGQVSVAIGGDYTSFFVPRMQDFLAAYPRVELSMRVARRSDSLAALQAGTTDLCMGVFPRLPHGIAAKVVARTTMALVMRSGDTEENGRLIIAPRGSAIRQLLRGSGFFEGRSNILECPTCQTAIDLVARGAGQAIVHSICARRADKPDLTIEELGERHGKMQLVIAYKRGARLSRAAQALFDHVVEA